MCGPKEFHARAEDRSITDRDARTIECNTTGAPDDLVTQGQVMAIVDLNWGIDPAPLAQLPACQEEQQRLSLVFQYLVLLLPLHGRVDGAGIRGW